VTDPIETDAPTLLGTIGDMAKAGAGFLAALLARIMGGIQGAMIALPLALGCQAQSDAAGKAAPAVEVVVEKPKPTAEEGPKKLGLFSITFYYVTNEEEVLASSSKKAAAKAAAANDNLPEGEAELAAVAPPEMVTIYAKKCEPIVEVTREFAQQLRIQGTGRLKDGRVLNVAGPCNCGTSPCYKEIPHQWGTAGSGRSLLPFRTVAVDPKLIKLGSLLYVPLLEGRTMPGRAPFGGFVHDGCVVADDTGGGIKDHQLDLFVGKKAWYLGMSASGSRGSHAWARHVPVFDGTKICERKGRKVARKTGAI
jgi:3D (Asp-Asp-Asp) domain-containing protein